MDKNERCVFVSVTLGGLLVYLSILLAAWSSSCFNRFVSFRFIYDTLNVTHSL